MANKELVVVHLAPNEIEAGIVKVMLETENIQAIKREPLTPWPAGAFANG